MMEDKIRWSMGCSQVWVSRHLQTVDPTLLIRTRAQAPKRYKL